MQENTVSLEELENFTRDFLNTKSKSNVIALRGELGAGKTTFVQHIGRSLGISHPITSPTFLLMKMYPTASNTPFSKLIHLDLYRVNDWEEIANLGIDELWNNPEHLVCIEWADRIQDHLPEQTQWVTFTVKDENIRSVQF